MWWTILKALASAGKTAASVAMNAAKVAGKVGVNVAKTALKNSPPGKIADLAKNIGSLASKGKGVAQAPSLASQAAQLMSKGAVTSASSMPAAGSTALARSLSDIPEGAGSTYTPDLETRPLASSGLGITGNPRNAVAIAALGGKGGFSQAVDNGEQPGSDMTPIQGSVPLAQDASNYMSSNNKSTNTSAMTDDKPLGAKIESVVGTVNSLRSMRPQQAGIPMPQDDASRPIAGQPLEAQQQQQRLDPRLIELIRRRQMQQQTPQGYY